VGFPINWTENKMIMAELFGKVGENSTALDTKEDVLTSNVFQLIKYLKPEFGIIPFLNYVFKENDIPLNLDIEREWKVEYHFWPIGTKAGREPDLLIYLKGDNLNFLFVIEAKYYSGPSDTETMEKEGKAYHNQLADEFTDLKKRKYKIKGESKKFDVKLENCFLLYLTKHNIRPKEDLERAIIHYSRSNLDREIDIRKHLIWANWTSIWKVLKDIRINEFPFYEIRTDLILLLEKKGFKEFIGFLFNSWDAKYKPFYNQIWFKNKIYRSNYRDAKFYYELWFKSKKKLYLDISKENSRFFKEGM